MLNSKEIETRGIELAKNATLAAFQLVANAIMFWKSYERDGKSGLTKETRGYYRDMVLVKKGGLSEAWAKAATQVAANVYDRFATTIKLDADMLSNEKALTDQFLVKFKTFKAMEKASRKGTGSGGRPAQTPAEKGLTVVANNAKPTESAGTIKAPAKTVTFDTFLAYVQKVGATLKPEELIQLGNVVNSLIQAKAQEPAQQQAA